jgi:hypothetical protein
MLVTKFYLMVSLEPGLKSHSFVGKRGVYSGLKLKIFPLPHFYKKFSVYLFG